MIFELLGLLKAVGMTDAAKKRLALRDWCLYVVHVSSAMCCISCTLAHAEFVQRNRLKS